MKTIKLNEHQMYLLKTIMEDASAPNFDDGDIKEYGDSTENGTTAVIHDDEGNPKYGEMPLGDEVTKEIPQNNYWANNVNGWRRIMA